jgi:hypothetical protein
MSQWAVVKSNFRVRDGFAAARTPKDKLEGFKMRVNFLPLSVAGLGAALCLSSPASATVYVIAPPPPNASLTFSQSLTGSFTNEYTFTLTGTQTDLLAFDTITLVPGSKFTSGVLELFNGTPAHPGTKVGSDAITAATSSSPPSATLDELLGAGKYYYEVAVVAKGPLGNVLAVSGVPELQTWAMLGLGFAALGFLGFAKGKGDRRAFVD